MNNSCYQVLLHKPPIMYLQQKISYVKSLFRYVKPPFGYVNAIFESPVCQQVMALQSANTVSFN